MKNDTSGKKKKWQAHASENDSDLNGARPAHWHLIIDGAKQFMNNFRLLSFGHLPRKNNNNKQICIAP